MPVNSLNLKALNTRFSRESPDEVLRWVKKKFNPRLAMITSFQVTGVVLLHLTKNIMGDITVYHIDTGYHFPETLEFKNRLIREWKLNVVTIKPKLTRRAFEKKYGKELYRTNPDLCCQINKVEPLQRLMRQSKIEAWISAIRRDQSPTRAEYTIFMRDQEGHLRIHPLINWDKEAVWEYVKKHNLPFHPLYDEGYSSIGCFPSSCTTRTTPDRQERDGRWVGKTKTECGIHLDLEEE